MGVCQHPSGQPGSRTRSGIPPRNGRSPKAPLNTTLMRAAVQRQAAGDLTSTAGPASQPGPASRATAAAITIAGTGEPCPGVACSGPGCWQRDTARYGLRRLVLFTACAAALQGHALQREMPPGAERLIRRGAA